MVGRARGEAAALCRPRAGNGAVPAACAPASAPVPAPARLGPASVGVGAAGSRAPAGAGPAGPGRAAALLITATGTVEGSGGCYAGQRGEGCRQRPSGGPRRERGGRWRAAGCSRAYAAGLGGGRGAGESPGRQKQGPQHLQSALPGKGRAGPVGSYAGGRPQAVPPGGRERLIFAGPTEPPGKPSSGLYRSSRLPSALAALRGRLVLLRRAAVRRLRWRA